MFPTYRTLTRRLALALVVSLLLWVGIIAGACQALAHHGDLTATTECVDGDRVVTWSQGWGNVPSHVTGEVRSRTGDGPWVDRGTTSGESGRIEWTVTYPGDTTTGPWEWVEIQFSNGHRIDSARRVEGLTACATPTPDPSPSPTPDPSPEPTPTVLPTPTPTLEPSPSPSPSPSPTPTPTPEPDPSPAPTPEPSPEPTPGPTPEPTPTPVEPSPEPTVTPEPTPERPTPEPAPIDDVPELAETGADLGLVLGVVLALCGLGAAIVVAARRKREGQR